MPLHTHLTIPPRTVRISAMCGSDLESTDLFSVTVIRFHRGGKDTFGSKGSISLPVPRCFIGTDLGETSDVKVDSFTSQAGTRRFLVSCI